MDTCRKLAVAISDEDYSLAAQLRTEKENLIQELPAVSQYTFHQIQEIQTGLEAGAILQQTQAVQRLGAGPLHSLATLACVASNCLIHQLSPACA